MSGNSEDGDGRVDRGRIYEGEKSRVEEQPAPSHMLYPHNALEAFGNGCLLDLRVRLAIEFLKAPMFTGIMELVSPISTSQRTKLCAIAALNAAAELMAQATARGWVEPLPEGGELDQRMRDQAKRTASFQVLQQLEGQRFAQGETASQIVPMAPRFPGPRGH